MHWIMCHIKCVISNRSYQISLFPKCVNAYQVCSVDDVSTGRRFDDSNVAGISGRRSRSRKLKIIEKMFIQNKDDKSLFYNFI
jgi:hypothetical protein